MSPDNPLQPFTKDELGAFYTALDFVCALGERLDSKSDFSPGPRLMEKIKIHFIAAGGDPKELEDPI